MSILRHRTATALTQHRARSVPYFSTSPTARGLPTPALIRKRPRVTQFRVLTFSKHICLSQWYEHCGHPANQPVALREIPAPRSIPHLPIRTSREGPTRGKKVQATSTQRNRHRRRGYHILPHFPASSTSLAEQRGKDKVPGRHGQAAPAGAPVPLTPGQTPGYHLDISKENMCAPGGASCYPALFPADTTLGGKRWLSAVWERNVAGERQ